MYESAVTPGRDRGRQLVERCSEWSVTGDADICSTYGSNGESWSHCRPSSGAACVTCRPPRRGTWGSFAEVEAIIEADLDAEGVNPRCWERDRDS
jgi:hypothetical protein